MHLNVINKNRNFYFWFIAPKVIMLKFLLEAIRNNLNTCEEI